MTSLSPPDQDGRKGLRLQRVVKTHSGMLPQSRTLEGQDQVGERQSAEGSDCYRQVGAGCRHWRGERAERLRHQAPYGAEPHGPAGGKPAPISVTAMPQPLSLPALNGGVSRGGTDEGRTLLRRPGKSAGNGAGCSHVLSSSTALPELEESSKECMISRA